MSSEQYSPDIEQRCRAAVERQLARYPSRLLAQPAFVQLARIALQRGRVSSPEQATIHVYAIALYIACSLQETSPHNDPDEASFYSEVSQAITQLVSSRRACQEIGYSELHAYLVDIARWRYPEVCDDVAQLALEQIFRSIHRCRQVGAFLKFASYYLINAARAILRQDAYAVMSLNQPLSAGEPGLTLSELLQDQSQAAQLEQVLQENLRAQLARAMADCIARHPRAKLQLAVVWLKFVENLDDPTIAARLQKSIVSIHTARSRGLRLLAHEPGFIRLAAEFGIRPELSADGKPARIL